MRPINIKQLATFSFAALLLASCSDNTNDATNGGNTATNTTIVGSAVTSVTDAQELAARVTNYKVSSTNTKAIDNSNSAIFEGVIEMPSEPATPADAKDLRNVNWQNKINAGNYKVSKGDGEFSMPNEWGTEGLVTIYVEDGATLKYTLWPWNNWKFKIIVKKGGKLVCLCNTAQNTEIDNYGTIEFGDGEIYIAKTFRTFGDLDCSNRTLKISSKCYVGGNLKAKTFNPGGSTINIKGNLDMGENDLKLDAIDNVPARINVDGKVTLKNLEMTNSTVLYSGCSVIASGNLNFNGGGTMYVDYLKAGSITLSSGASIYLKDKSMISCEGELGVYNQDNAHIYLEGDGAQAVVNAGSFLFNNGEPKNGTFDVTIFSTQGQNHPKIIVNYGEFKLKDSKETITPDFGSANVYLASSTNASDVTISKTTCNPEGWNEKEDGKKDDDKKEDEKKPGLDLISKIDYDEHDHDISATGIMPLNGKMYMSYHTRGKGHGGCVEVFSPVQNNVVKMDQYLYDQGRDLDFNHILAVTHVNENNVKESKVYMPGSSNKKGGILAYMDILDGGLLNTKSTSITTKEENKTTITYNEPLQFIQMNPATKEYSGYDENCVVYNDQTKHLIVMTTEGYLVYDLNYNEVDRVKKDGKAKHVAIGDGKIATLCFTKRDADSLVALPAQVQIFDQATDLKTVEKEFSVDMIQPNHGKNVIAIDNGYLYVCRGGYGMYVYDMSSGKEVWHYQMPNPLNQKGNYKALANGLFVDDKYVYVAYGSHGIVVLDKNTHEVIAQREVVKSANYVYVYDGYIYVAYGRDRLQVFKLCGTGASADYSTGGKTE